MTLPKRHRHNFRVDGWILTNTTVRYAGQWNLPERGGVSGRLLTDISKAALQVAVQNRLARELIISVGGVKTIQDIQDRLKIGADLVQMYSSLIFEGPALLGRLAKQARSV